MMVSSNKKREQNTVSKNGEKKDVPKTEGEKLSPVGKDEGVAGDISGKTESGESGSFEEEYNSLNDKFLRLAADFENYKKRSAKEKEQARITAIRELALSIFQIIDSLELALRHGSQSEVDSEGLMRGVQLTYEQSVSELKNFGIVQMSVEAGEKFNPAVHQAIESRPSEDFEQGRVVLEIAKGYAFENGLIRPVTVAVSSGPEEKPEE